MMVQKGKVFYSLAGVCLLIGSLISVIWGAYQSNIGILSISVFMIWATAICFALSKRERNIIFIFLLITFFIFLLSRVFVRWITIGEVYQPFGTDTMRHIYILMYVSLGGLIIGSYGNFQLTLGKQNNNNSTINRVDLELLKRISAPIAVFMGFCQLAVALEKVFYYQVGLNGALRISFTSSLPGIITRFSNIYILCFCIFLATFPKKRQCIWAFIQFLIIAACKMLYGSRSDFMLSLMFMVVYFVIRDRLNERNETETVEKWIGTKEILLIIVSVPLLIILLVFVGFYRVGGTYHLSSFTDTLLDFMESQGTSIDVLGYAYEKADSLPKAHFLYLIDNTYTFLVANPVSSLFTGAHSYSVNTIERALHGTSLDQTLYYFVNQSSFLNGYGCGSSYIAESYLAFGYIGSFLFNACFSWVLNRINYYSFSVTWKNVLIFVFLQSLFFIPRAGFDDFVGDLSTTMNIICIFMIWILYKLLNKENTV